MYDRTILRTAARNAPRKHRAANANQLAAVLAKHGMSRMTAYRLWDGDTAPSGPVNALMYRLYRVHPGDLLVPAVDSAPAPAADGTA